MCHTRRRRELLSGRFEVCDPSRDPSERKGEEKEGEGDDEEPKRESMHTQKGSFEMTSANIIRTLICSDEEDA